MHHVGVRQATTASGPEAAGPGAALLNRKDYLIRHLATLILWPRSLGLMSASFEPEMGAEAATTCSCPQPSCASERWQKLVAD